MHEAWASAELLAEQVPTHGDAYVEPNKPGRVAVASSQSRASAMVAPASNELAAESTTGDADHPVVAPSNRPK